MRNKKRVVLVNGAPGVGKSWLCDRLSEQHRTQCARVGLNTALIETMSVITGLDLKVADTYDVFKKTVFENNRTGREWMITVSESSKEFDPLVWAKAFKRKVFATSMDKLVLCDSFGFPVEFEYFIAQEDVETLNVYIDEDGGEAYKTEGDYRKFANDSRFDLSRHCSIRSVSSAAALTQVKHALSLRGW